jgi:hypothetical protein
LGQGAVLLEVTLWRQDIVEHIYFIHKPRRLPVVQQWLRAPSDILVAM